MKIMSIDYTIGDDIVALTNHSQGIFKEGNTYICKGLREKVCGCIALISYQFIKYNNSHKQNENKRRNETIRC